MTVPNTPRRAGPFTGTGALVSYPFTFRVFAAADIAVTTADTDDVETVGVLNSNFLVEVNVDQDTDPGGSVQYAVGGVATALPTGYTLAITGNRDYSQEADLPQGGAFNARAVEDALDSLEMQIQQIRDTVSRAVQLTVLSPIGTEVTLPIPEAAAIIGWNADGSGLQNYSPDTAVSTDLLAADLASVSSPNKGDAQIGWSAVYSIVDGVLTRHASVNAAVASIGATVCELVVRDATTLTGNVTVPATLTLRIENGAIINFGGFTLTVNGRFPWPAGQCFTGAGKVVFGYDSCGMVFPQWWGAKGDAAADGSSGTDCTAALTAAIAASTSTGLIGDTSFHPVYVGQGNWLTGAQTFPVAMRLFGAGRHSTNFIARNGTAGKWFTDGGSASKIILEGFAMYAHGLAGITHGLQLGRNGTEHGTEGYVKDIWVRDCSAAGAYGVDILANVGIYQGITVQACAKNLRIGGSPSHVSEIVSMQPTEVGADLSYCTVNGLHIEAPGNSCLPLLMSRNTHIDGLSIALADSTTISHLIEFDAACGVWSFNNLMLFFGSTPASVTVTNGNMKRADGTYFGGNATAGSVNGTGNYSSETAGQKLQGFTLRVTNTGGTLQHRISTTGGVATNFASKINGASATLVNTPTGADGSTAMAAGGKIGSASNSIFWLDTASQKEADSLPYLTDVLTTTADPLTVVAAVLSLNINGVTRTRLAFQFFLESTGGAYALTTANIAVGEFVQVSFMGYVA